jgi:hypothetical protein
MGVSCAVFSSVSHFSQEKRKWFPEQAAFISEGKFVT